MSGLVNPAAFPARSADLDTGAITGAASSVRSMGAAVEERTRAISARWSGLGAHYEAPEQGQVYALMDPAVTSADELHTAFTAVGRHLDGFAAALAAIKPRLASLEQRAAAFRADVIDGVQVDASSAKDAGFGDMLKGAVDWVPGVDERQVTVPWYEDGDTVERNNALVAEYDRIAADISAASADCANAISALVEGICAAPVQAVPAEAFAASTQPMPWGAARQEDRNCPESVSHGVSTFGTDLWDGARQMVVGYNPATGGYFEGSAYGQAWGGLGDLVGSTLLMATPVGWVAAGMAATGNTDNDFSRFMVDRAEVTAGGWGSLIGYDAAAEDPWHAWKEDGVAAGTGAFLSVGTFFIPGAGQVGAGLKAGSVGAKTARIAAAGADFAVQGGSWAVRGGLRVTTGLRGALRFGDDVLPAPGQAAAAAGATSVRLSPTALINAVDDVPGAATPVTSTPVSDSVGLAPSRADAPDTTARPAPDAPRIPDDPASPSLEAADNHVTSGAAADHQPVDSRPSHLTGDLEGPGPKQPLDPADGSTEMDAPGPARTETALDDAVDGASGVRDQDAFQALAAEKVAMYERLAATQDPDSYLRPMFEGSKFNWENYHRYDYREVLVEAGDPPRRFRVDSYTPGRAIVSRKLTQLGEVQSSTAIGYIDEMLRKYNPNDSELRVLGTDANRAQFGDAAGRVVGQPLRGPMVLEVPVQRTPIPQGVLDHAAEMNVIIRDVTGTTYGS